MTREEIVKALRVCSSDTPCINCPAMGCEPKWRCTDYAMMCAADMLEQDAEHNPADIDEICALHARVENLTLYLQEAFALCPDDLAVLDEWHPGLPGYAPPQGCKSCKIDD